MREPPRMPPAADCSATGLSLNGCSFMRDIQSIAFFRPPGIDQLYSGDTMISPSAPRTDGVRPGVHVGRKAGRVLNVEIVDRKGLPSHCDSNDLFCPADTNAGFETKRQSPRLSSTLSGCASPNEKARGCCSNRGPEGSLKRILRLSRSLAARKDICAAASTPVRQHAVDARHTC